MRWTSWTVGVAAWAMMGCGASPFGGGDAPSGPGPWPKDEALSYSQQFAAGTPESVGVDDAYNLWLLDDGKIGVLRPGDSSPRWTEGVGQAGRGFRSSVLCGGEGGQAYVGYITTDLARPDQATAEEKAMGDADLVRLRGDGTVELAEHLSFVNSNDPRYDETRSILTCAKVMRGPQKGELYLGTNHAVTRVRGREYSDHRHPVFRHPDPEKGSLHIGYHYAVSVTREGDVFLANEWKLALVTPTPVLEEWMDATRTPWKLDTYAEALGSQIDMDRWRATAQTVDGRYFLAAKERGLWELQLTPRRYTRVEGLPTDRLTALAATDDGSLFIGTADGGLWRMTKEGNVSAVGDVQGNSVRQLVYDPTLAPSMLHVVTDGGWFVLRGY